jgi:hypothetical protein
VSQVSYVVTEKVRHIAAWTRDRNERYTGAPRPICGGNVLDWRHSVYPLNDYEDPKAVERAARKPVCRRCLKVLAALNEVAS